MTLGATFMTALWPKPTMTDLPASVSSVKPGISSAFSMTGVKSLLGDVRDAGPADEARREDVGDVARRGRWMQLVVISMAPGNVVELLHLVLPRRAVVAVEVWLYFLSSGYPCVGQHLAVRVDVDALALGLLEQHLEVLEVVAGDEDRLALLWPSGTFVGTGWP